jgi:hypothetical protein
MSKSMRAGVEVEVVVEGAPPRVAARCAARSALRALWRDMAIG